MYPKDALATNANLLKKGYREILSILTGQKYFRCGDNPAMVREEPIYESVQSRVLGTQSQDHEDPIFKPVMVLAFALFLLFAPDPDSSVIADLTSNFIVPVSHSSVLP